MMVESLPAPILGRNKVIVDVMVDIGACLIVDSLKVGQNRAIYF